MANKFNDLQKLERRIVRAVAEDAIAYGYDVSVHDEEEVAVPYTTSMFDIMAEVGATDMTYLHFRDRRSGNYTGWVMFVHGNGHEVLTDHTANPDVDDIVSRAMGISDLVF